MDSPEGRTRNTFGTENLSKEDDLVKQEESHIIIDPGTKHKKLPAFTQTFEVPTLSQQVLNLHR